MDNKILLALGVLLLQDKANINLKDKNFLGALRKINLGDDSMERGIEILSRSKKYMKKDEKLLLSKVETILDLTRGIKKLNKIGEIHEIEESDFFRSMDGKDKRNMMIKEIIEVFPDDKKTTINRAIDMKSKFSLLTELLKVDEDEKGSSKKTDLFNLKGLKNLKAIGELLSSEDDNDKKEED